MKIINEEVLTSSELEKREEIIKKLKPSRKSFIHRYGKDAEKIMYAVATKQAKNMNKNKIQELVKLSLSKKLNEEDIEVGADKYEYEKSNQDAINQLDDLEQKLKNHDWYYSFSDSNQEYLKGQKQIKDINNLIKSLKEKGYNEEAKELYNKYKPSKFPELTESEINSKEYISSRKNPTDIISMDVPLFLRMLEYAKEDAKTDMDLHDVTEKATTLSSTKNILTMSDYIDIVGGELDEKKLTAAEKRKKEDIVKGMKKSFKGNEGAMYAIATDKAKKLAESEENMLDEAYVPDNIKKFAKQKGVSALVNKVAGWAEKVGKRINGGTAIGKNYSTLILDMGHQTSDIYINIDNETIDLYGEEVNSFPEFKRVYDEHNKKNIDESEKKGLMVFGRTPLDNNAIKNMVNDGDFYAEWNPAEGYWFFPEVEEEYDELEYYLEQEFNKRNINARFEGIFNEGLSKGYWAKKIPGGKMEERIGNEVGDKVYFKGDLGEKYPASQGYYGIIEDSTPASNYNTLATYLVTVYDKNDNEIRTLNTNFLNLSIKTNESYATLVNKLKKQGKPEKISTAIAGAVASYKAKGGGSGPTSKQKTKMAEIVLSKLKGK